MWCYVTYVIVILYFRLFFISCLKENIMGTCATHARYQEKTSGRFYGRQTYRLINSDRRRRPTWLHQRSYLE